MRARRFGRWARLALGLALGATAVGAASTVSATTPEAVTIRFTWWGNPERDAKTTEMIDAFEEAFPHITVQAEPTVFDGYFDKLAVSFSAGDAPDVMTLGGSYPTEYGGNGVLLDLNEVADTVGLANYPANTLTAATIGDAVYGLPTGGNALGLFVNLDLVEQAGLEVPDDATWTWAEFVQFAGDLSAALPDDVYGTDWRIQEAKGPFTAQFGEVMYPAEGGIGVTVESLTALFEIPTQLLENGGMPSAEVTTELANTQMEQTLFGQGRAATMLGYSNQLQGFADLLGVPVTIVKLPGEADAVTPGLAVLPSQHFSIYSETGHPEAAAQLVNWLLNEPEPAKIILGDRGLSFNTTVLEAITPLLAEYDQINAAYIARITEEGGPYLPPPQSGQGEVDEMTLRIHDEVLFGSLSPEEAAQQWLDEATSIVP